MQLQRSLTNMLLGMTVYTAMVAQPTLIVHCDINKTIIAEDLAGGKSLDDVLIDALAEQCIAQWDSSLPAMSYTLYVKEYLFPGGKHDATLKKLRRQTVRQFITWLQETNHPLHAVVEGKFRLLRDKLVTSPSIIFPSFYAGIAYLKTNNIPHAIVLRTFGRDLDRIIDEIHTHVAPDFFSWRGTFKNNTLELLSCDEKREVTLYTPAEIYEFLKTNGNIAIHDDWAYWNNNGERSSYGKLFPIDINDHDVISLFADDNGHPRDGILNPRHPHTNAELDIQELINADYVRIVDTIEALERDDYFVSYFQAMLAGQCKCQ